MLKVFSASAPLLFLLMLTYGCNVKSDVVYQSDHVGKVTYHYKDNDGCDLKEVDKNIALFYQQIERRELVPLKAIYQEDDPFIQELTTLPSISIHKGGVEWYIPLAPSSKWIYVKSKGTINVFAYPESLKTLCK